MDKEDMYTASLDFGNKIALPNQKGQDAGLCKLITGLFKIDVCHGSTLGGGGGIGIAALALGMDIGGGLDGGDILGGAELSGLTLVEDIGGAPGGGDMLGGDVLGGPVGTCVGGGETTVV